MNDNGIRDAWVRWIGDQEWDDYWTVNFNCRSSVLTAKKKLGDLCQRFDRHHIGRRYLKKSGARTLVIGFPEHVSSNIHFHCLVRHNLKCDLTYKTKQSLLEYWWKGLLPSGTVHCQAAYDPEGAARYSTKEYFRADRFHDAFLSSDFWPQTAKEEDDLTNWSGVHRLKARTQYANYQRRRRAASNSPE